MLFVKDRVYDLDLLLGVRDRDSSEVRELFESLLITLWSPLWIFKVNNKNNAKGAEKAF